LFSLFYVAEKGFVAIFLLLTAKAEQGTMGRYNIEHRS